MDNFEKLGFEVEVGGKSYTTALSRLDKIISRLDKINKLQSGEKFNKKGFEHFSKTGELTKADTKSAKRSGNVSVYQDLQKQIAKEIELNHIWKQQVETLTQLNIAKQKKLTYDLLANNEDVKSANVQAEISKIMAKTAIDTGVLAKEEGKLAIAKQATAQYNKQSITNMARLQAEQKALNDGKWEEARRIELANNARKKEIDQRLKQELGIKKTNKSLTKYLAKLTSAVMIARRLGHFFSSAIQESAAYTENLVLFKTAFGETWESQLQWAEELADGYGLARNEVIKFAGTFRELASSLGIVGEAADNVTHIVTNLGYDLSALFNTSVETAMEKLQSGVFTGQTKPLRSFGIDISQESIDRLFETNEALAGLNVNARGLSQSEKTLARLLITIKSARNSFGTMANEINNLQSQFRIFQGSISNFKLAVGEFIEKPLKQAMIYVNGFVIAMTNVLKAFTPKKEEKKGTIIDETAESAEEAIEAIDELNGRLAGFDKFNVLGQSNATASNIEITEKLNELIAKEAELYDKEVAEAMKRVKNEAVAISKAITDWFIVLDDDGKFKEFTGNAKALGVALATVGGLLIKGAFTKNLAIAMQLLSEGKTLTGTAKAAMSIKNALTPTNILLGALATTLIYAYTTNENFRKSINDTAKILGGAFLNVLRPVGELISLILKLLAPTVEFLGNALSKVINLTNNLGLLEPILVGIISLTIASKLTKTSSALKKVIDVVLGFKGATDVITKFKTGFGAFAGGFVAGFGILSTVIDDLEGSKKAIVSWCSVVFGALGAVLGVILAIRGGVVGGIIGASLAGLGVGALLAGISGVTNKEFFSAHADGGYTNANLIMTHENGKREWVGKAAGSSAIVNDTQMSDIMEVAVAKGVYRALATQANMGSNTATNERIVVKIGEDEVFNAVRRRARREGVGFAKL